jgi:PHS family inorganic phosphate transporter-like MFS transporter
MYGVELAIIIAATLGQALSAPSEAVTMTGLLIFWRVIMGIGIVTPSVHCLVMRT